MDPYLRSLDGGGFMTRYNNAKEYNATRIICKKDPTTSNNRNQHPRQHEENDSGGKYLAGYQTVVPQHPMPEWRSVRITVIGRARATSVTF